MPLRVIGAGLGRTGTNSLKLVLEKLLGGPCYHMFELMQRREQLGEWERAVAGEAVDWDALLGDFAATVDWPGCAFWRQISDANPDAMVLLSTRDAESWCDSMEKTILPIMDAPAPPGGGDDMWVRGQTMIRELFTGTLTPDWSDRDALIAGYERHNAAVRSGVPAERLIEWRTGEGWEPICDGLGLPIPDLPFPHENASGEFSANVEQHWREGSE